MVACIAVLLSFRATKAAQHSVNLLKEQLDNNRLAMKVDVHSRFQNQIRDIQKKFPIEVNNPDWQPNSEERRLITLYWYIVFDEWFTCTQGGPELETLWSKHYVHGVKSALRMPSFKQVIERMFDAESTFLGMGREFKAVINNLCYEVHGRDLLTGTAQLEVGRSRQIQKDRSTEGTLSTKNKNPNTKV